MCLGIPGKVLDISACAEGIANSEGGPFALSGTVDFGGVKRTVNLALVEDVQVGDYVIVHAGFALNLIDEDEATKIFEYLKSMDNLELG